MKTGDKFKIVFTLEAELSTELDDVTPSQIEDVMIMINDLPSMFSAKINEDSEEDDTEIFIESLSIECNSEVLDAKSQRSPSAQIAPAISPGERTR